MCACMRIYIYFFSFFFVWLVGEESPRPKEDHGTEYQPQIYAVCDLEQLKPSCKDGQCWEDTHIMQIYAR